MTLRTPCSAAMAPPCSALLLFAGRGRRVLQACGARGAVVAFGRTWTGNPDQPWAGGVAMRGDTILAVGDSADIARYVGSEHPGRHRARWHGRARIHGRPHPFPRRRHPAGQRRPPHRQHAGRSSSPALRPLPPSGSPVNGSSAATGTTSAGPARRCPDRSWIDSVTPNNPVFVNRLDGHMGVANSAALRAAGITKATKDIPGGEIVRDPRTGEPTGMLKDNAMGPVYARDAAADRGAARRGAGPRPRVRRHQGRDRGQLHERADRLARAPIQRAHAAGTLTVRTKMFFPIQHWRWVADTVAAIGGGDDWLRIDGVKGYMDGSLGLDHGAALPALSRRARTPAASKRRRSIPCAAGCSPPIRRTCRWPSTPSATGPTRCSSTSSTR